MDKVDYIGMDIQKLARKILEAFENLEKNEMLIVSTLMGLFVIILVLISIVSLIAAWIKFFWVAIIFA